MLRNLLLAAFVSILATPATAQTPDSREQITLSFAPVVKRVMPAVVNIYTKHVEKVAAPVSPLMADPFFNQFFANNGFGGMPHERVVHSLGSGVVVGTDGTIVTSYHVVKGSDEINVVLSDKREFKGKVVKVDERSDLAVLKVDTKNETLPALQLRDSDTLEVGDLVLAVGNPFGVGQTVTSGIISALARSESSISDYQFFIQTDAAINPGNSGGALVDMQGKLIGINTAIFTHSGGYQGISFAIPSNMVQTVLKEKTGKNGDVIRPWFGITAEAVTHEVADAQGLGLTRGVLVETVTPGSPAEKAGIKVGDIVTAIGDNEIDDSQSMNVRIAVVGIDNPTTVSVWRGGSEVKLPITFGAAPAGETTKTATFKGNHPFNGATVAMLTPEIAQKLGVQSSEPRVVVLHDNGGSWGMDILAGDIVVAVNGKQIHSVADLEKSFAPNARQYQVSVLRHGGIITMSVSH